MSNSAQQTRELVSGAITMIDKAVNNELSLSAQFCVGCLLSVKQVLEKVLAVPLRECDVGTAYEQSVRMARFCKKQYEKRDDVAAHICSACKFHNSESDCVFEWAQMPYIESGVS